MKPGRIFYGFSAETVLFPLRPLARESLLSWVARTTIENHLPNITTILRDVGQARRHVMADVMGRDIDVEGLAKILGSDLKTIEALRSAPIGSRRVRYLGASIRASDMQSSIRRFAPATMARDDVPYYRAPWLLKLFPVCVESWQVIRSMCECGFLQHWSTVTTIEHCNRCGQDLRSVDSPYVPEQYRPALQSLANILFGDEMARKAALAALPSDLQGEDPGDIFEFVLLMARVVDPDLGNPRRAGWREQPLRLASALAIATAHLQQWPATPWSCLESAKPLRQLTTHSRALTLFSHVITGAMPVSLSGKFRATLDNVRDRIPVATSNASDEVMDVSSAANILGVEQNTVRSARRNGLLTARFLFRQGHLVCGYDRREVEALAVADGGWPYASTVGDRLGIPPYAIEQLCAMGRLQWAKAPFRTLKQGLRICPESISTLEDDLLGRAERGILIDNPVSLTVVMRGIGAREKPWGRVLDALVDGHWRYTIPEAGSLAKQICVDMLDVEDIRRSIFEPHRWSSFPFSDNVNLTDACDILNVGSRFRDKLHRYSCRRHNDGWVFVRADILRLATKVITGSELQAYMFLSPKTTASTIRRAQLTACEFGFVREGAATRFAAALR